MKLHPEIWGPHYWFVLHTIALTYSERPNDTIKKKYYDFFQNLPLFIPVQEIGNQWSVLLDKYPVTPYLDSRESLIKWIHFIHNIVNQSLGKESIDITEALSNYYDEYKPKIKIDKEAQKNREKLIFVSLLVLLILLNVYLLKK